MSVAALCDLYLAEGCKTKKPSTLATDRGRIERHIKPLLGAKRISEITRADIERFMRDVAAGKTAIDVKTKKFGRAMVEGRKGTATRTVGLLGGIFSFAVARQLRTENPVRGVKRYQDKKGETFLSSAELAKLGQAVAQCESEGASPAPIAIIRLLAFTGARKSEIASLKWSEVDLQRGYLALGDSKTGAKIIPPGACRRSPMRRRAHRGRDLYLSTLPAKVIFKVLKRYGGGWRRAFRRFGFMICGIALRPLAWRGAMRWQSSALFSDMRT